MNGTVGRVVGFWKPREAIQMGAQIMLPELRDPAASAPDPSDPPPDPRLLRAQAEQREQKLKAILATNNSWPAVQFTSGPLMLCVPLTFEVINADAQIEAVRDQVSTKICACHLWCLGMGC